MLLIFGLCANANAMQKLYTFQQLERRALIENYRVRAQQNRVDALSHEKSIAAARTWPQLTSFYRYNPDNVSLLEDNFTSPQVMTLRLSQDLIGLFSKNSARQRAIQAEADVTASRLRKSKKAALLQFREDYLDFLANRNRAAHYKELIAIYEKLMELHETRYRHQEDLLTDVLKVETDLVEAQGLLQYYQARLAKQKIFLAAYFDLKMEEIAWNEIAITPPVLNEDEVLMAAVSKNEEIRLSLARAQAERTRGASSAFEGMQLAPFVGFRWHRGQMTGVGTRPEVGVRFSMPLGVLKKRSHLARRNSMRQTAWQLDAKETAFNVKKQVALALDDYSLAKARIGHSQKRIELNRERIRIERSKLKQSMRSVTADPANLLKLKGETVNLKMEKQLYAYAQLRTYYQLLYLSGGLEPERMPRQQAEISPVATKAYPTALWLWKPRQVLLSEDAKEAFLAFCRTRKVNKVFLSLNSSVLAALQQGATIRNFVTQLHQAGVQVSALFGEPSWVEESHRANLLGKVRTLLDYNIMAPKLAQFDAVHLDIEPHTLPRWREDEKSLLDQLVATVAAVKQLISHLQPETPIELDLPTFYHKIDQTALKKLVELADNVTIMAYERTDPVAVLRAARELIYLCQAANTECTVGLNARDFENESQLQTLIEDLGPMISDIARTPGFAIHDYHHYRDLVKRSYAVEDNKKARK